MNAEEIFNTAVARPPSERPALVAVACAGDELLLRRVEALLHAHEKPGQLRGRSASSAGGLCHSNLVTIKAQNLTVWSASFSPDGARLVTAGGTMARVWDGRPLPKAEAIVTGPRGGRP